MAMHNKVARLADAFLQEMPAPDELFLEEIAGVSQFPTLLSMERFGAEMAPRLERHSGDPAGIGHP
jgi:hypothetical protein